MPEPRRKLAVRTRAMRGRGLANWLTIGTVLLALQSLAPTKVELAYSKETGWDFYLHVGSAYGDRGEVASNRKPRQHHPSMDGPVKRIAKQKKRSTADR
jgi:hypothetical protein